jgi:hypothetical protein
MGKKAAAAKLMYKLVSSAGTGFFYVGEKTSRSLKI